VLDCEGIMRGHYVFQTNYFDLQSYAETFAKEQVIIVSNRDLGVRPFLYGEDYYISSLMSQLERKGIHVDTAIVSGKKIRVSGSCIDENVDEVVHNFTTIILHSNAMSLIFKSKMQNKFKLVMPVYFLKNKCLPTFENLINGLRPFFWQKTVDEYLVASPTIAYGLRKIGVAKTINVVLPAYVCPYCNRGDSTVKEKLFKNQLPTTVYAVYIGPVLPHRFDLKSTVNALERNFGKYKLTVYTASPVKEQLWQENGSNVEIVCKRLSEKEKCEVLKKSHVFVAPRKSTTMEPTISIIEAEYHGNIIGRF
jgi:glycosyltransferase involved in cell wall biosynthesis